MVKKKTKMAVAAVASFGVAMSSVYISNDLQADVLDITWNGGNATATAPFVTYGGVSQFIDQVPNNVTTTSLGAINEGGQFYQWNDTFGTDGIGRTMELGIASAAIGPMSMRVASSGEVIDPASFVGQLNAAGTAPGDIGNAGNGDPLNTSFNGTGSLFVAVRPLEAPTNLYWYKVTFTDQGALVYAEGEYGSMGESLTVGGSGGDCANPIGDVNFDGIVSLLDVAPFVAAITSGDFLCEADINGDGEVSLLDVSPFVEILSGG